MSIFDRSSDRIRRVRFVVGMFILGGMTIFSLISNSSDRLQVCESTQTAHLEPAVSCRPLKSRDPAVLFAASAAAILLANETRGLQLPGAGVLQPLMPNCPVCSRRKIRG
ncbi:hypothetical protein [Nocardia asiatica]|uniref:hypothetical protein n=1 Tax=Nocardia asiatica TaxID=209252 RepID=UPI002454BE0A|nr:hypothetical protein [Nocardia asiatica]